MCVLSCFIFKNSFKTPNNSSETAQMENKSIFIGEKLQKTAQKKLTWKISLFFNSFICKNSSEKLECKGIVHVSILPAGVGHDVLADANSDATGRRVTVNWSIILFTWEFNNF